MHVPLFIEEHDAYSAWWGLLSALHRTGTSASPRGKLTAEHLGVSIRVNDGLSNIINHPSRNLNYRFAVAEWLWIMSGTDNLQYISQYNAQIAQFSDDGLTLAGAYGPRIKDQLSWLLLKLDDLETRQAVITIWKPGPLPSKDIPCTIALQFLYRDERLNLIITMRSSDVWLGFPYDFYTFSQLLNCVCGVKNLDVGWVQFNLGSSHLYMENDDTAQAVLRTKELGKYARSWPLNGLPPTWLYDVMKSRTMLETFAKESGPWVRFANVLTSQRSEALDLLTR